MSSTAASVSPSIEQVQLQVARGGADALRTFRRVDEKQALPVDVANTVVVRVERFGYTSNNVTYGLYGAAMKYFDFFPSLQDKSQQFGVIPVWGYGVVEYSSHDRIPVGTRLYGFFPSSRYMTVTVSKTTQSSFIAHRPQIPPNWAVYNQYFFTDKDPYHFQEFEDAAMIYRPLFFTSFYLDDFLQENDFFGSRAVVITSASSKTSYALASLLKSRKCQVIGLTSTRNVQFVQRLHFYDLVLSYSQLTRVPHVATVLVDVAGNVRVCRDIGERLGKELIKIILVGSAQGHAPRGQVKQLKENVKKSEMFFAPQWIKGRLQQWGPDETTRRTTQAWKGFLQHVSTRDFPGRFVKLHGPGAVFDTHCRFLAGHARPSDSYICSMWEPIKSKL